MARVLLIEDEELVRAMLRQALETAGYEVIEASNGRNGLSKYDASAPDIVVMDILMPEKEGIETIRDLRRNDPGIKILAISGGGRTGNMEFLKAAGALGASATLAKPFGMREFIEAVRSLLGAQQGQS